MDRKKVEEIIKNMNSKSVARLSAMSEKELKRLLLSAQKAVIKEEKERVKAMDEAVQIQIDKRKSEKLRAHFKILAGAIVLNALHGFDLDYYIHLPRHDRRKKGEQPPNPDELFVRDFCQKIGLKSGQPPV